MHAFQPGYRHRLSRLGFAAVGLLILACGGSGDVAPNPPPPPPPPAPVVTTVDVTPATKNLQTGDSLQFSATVKDQSGNPVSGKTPAWSASPLTVATISASGLVKAIGVGTASITATVEGRNGVANVVVTAPARIEIDSTHSAQGSIGSNGGSLTLSSGQTTFLLTVPKAALDAPVQIVMRPLTALRELPASGQFFAGVKLEPTGTTFLKPLTLRVVAPLTPIAGTAIAGYIADDSGQVTALTPATRSGDTLTLSVPHFSVGGWGQFVPAQFPPEPPPPTQSSGTGGFISAVTAAEVMQSSLSTFLKLFRDWQAQVILPQMASALLPDPLFKAAYEADQWLFYLKDAEVRIGGIRGRLVPEEQAIRQALGQTLTDGINSLNARCSNSGTGVFAVDAVRAFMLQAIAATWTIDDVAHGLDLLAVTHRSCVSVMNTLADFPATPTPGQLAQLDLTYGVKFSPITHTVPQLANIVFKVSLDLFGTTTDGNQILQTDAGGHLSGAVTPTGAEDFTALMMSCIHPSNGAFLDNICNFLTVTRPFGTTVTGNVTILSQQALVGISNVRKFVGNLTIGPATSGNPITTTDLIELRGLREVTGDLTIVGPGSISKLTGLAGLIKVGGTLKLRNIPQVTTLGPLGTLDYGGLDLEAMDGLTTLGGLHAPPAIMSGDIRMVKNKNLFDASIFRNVTSVGGALDIQGNPLFVNLDDVGSITDVGHAATIGGIGLTSVAALANLQTIDGDLRLMVNELDHLSTLDLPALTTVGGHFYTDVNRFVTTPTTTSLLPIRLTALTHIIGGTLGGGGASAVVRPYSLFFPSLQAVGQTASGVNIDQVKGLRSLIMGAFNTAAGVINLSQNQDLQTVVIGSVSTPGIVNINLNPALTTLQVDGVFQADGAALNIAGNPALTALHLNGPIQAGGTFNIDNNDALTVIPFGGPVQVLGTLNIDHNKSLTLIQFSGGTVGETLNIDNNLVLSSLLGSLASIAGTLNVDNNPKLSNQAAMAWAAGIAVGGGKFIVHNGTP
jgi:hypothetical protein